MRNINIVHLSKNFDKNIDYFKDKFQHNDELAVRCISLDGNSGQKGALLYIDGIVNSQLIREHIIEPLSTALFMKEQENVIEHLAYQTIQAENVTVSDCLLESVKEIVNGKTVVLIDGYEQCIIVDTANWEKRQASNSTKQRKSIGPMIAFSEQTKFNLNLLHNILRTSTFSIKKKEVGRVIKKEVSIVYLHNLVDEMVLHTVLHSIDSLDVDYVIESRIIEEVLEGDKKTLFPLTFVSDLPDQTAAALLEGRIAIFVDGTPSAIIVPCLFVQFFQSPVDYYLKASSLFSRLLTFFSYFVTILLPGVAISIERYHRNWIPKEFVKKFDAAETLLPNALELFLLLLIIQIISVASFRIAVDYIVLLSLVSTIVVGTTAVDASLIHPINLIFAGLTYITASMLDTGTFATTLNPSRYTFFLIGLLFGVTGMVILMILGILYLSRLRSVGVPYLAPIIPFRFHEWKDVFIRGDLKKLINSKHKYPHDK